MAVREFVKWEDLIEQLAPMPGGLALPIVVAADAWRLDPRGLRAAIDRAVDLFRRDLAAMPQRERQLYLGTPQGRLFSCRVRADGRPVTPRRDVFNDIARFRGTPETAIDAVCRKLRLWPCLEALRAYSLMQRQVHVSSKYQEYADLLAKRLPWLADGLWPAGTTQWTWTWHWQYDTVTAKDAARYVTGRSRPAPRTTVFL